MDTLLIVTQTPQGREIPLKLFDDERADLLEAQAQAVGMDLAAWVSLLLETSAAIYPDDIEPGRDVDRKVRREAKGKGLRRVALREELLARLAGAEWSNPPRIGVTDWIGITCALAAMEPENGAAVRALAAQGKSAQQVAHALLTMEWEDIEALAGSLKEEEAHGTR